MLSLTDTQPGALQSIYLPRPARITRIVDQTRIEKLFYLEFEDGSVLGHKPGQFVEVSLFGIGEAPISVSSPPSDSPTFELMIRNVGNVTNAIHQYAVGDRVGIRGPFGSHFDPTELYGKDVLFVNGGCGLAPARSLIKLVTDPANRSRFGRVILLFGCKTPHDRLFQDELAAWKARKDMEYFETVDRPAPGWEGHVGVITTLFQDFQVEPLQTRAVVVGPPIMYKFVLAELKRKGIPDENILMSLERRMKCGVGKCGHCQINGIYACQEGPVFRFSDVKHLKEAI